MNKQEYFGKLIGAVEPADQLLANLTAQGVLVELFPDRASPYSGNGLVTAAADYHHDQKEWRVYYPASGKAHQLFHELVHIKLASIDKFPMMVSDDPQYKPNVMELNNDFDHAQVLPIEIKTYPEARAYWERDLDRKFKEISFEHDDQLAMLNRKISLMRGWLIIPGCIPDTGVANRYGDALRRERWFESAETMAKAVQRAGLKKSDGIQAFRECLGLNFPPHQSVRFITI